MPHSGSNVATAVPPVGWHNLLPARIICRQGQPLQGLVFLSDTIIAHGTVFPEWEHVYLRHKAPVGAYRFGHGYGRIVLRAQPLLIVDL